MQPGYACTSEYGLCCRYVCMRSALSLCSLGSSFRPAFPRWIAAPVVFHGCFNTLDACYFSALFCTFFLVHSEVHITWDEPTIAEHDKLRGTRQKIDEPSTPYHYGSGESSTGSDCESAGTVLYRVPLTSRVLGGRVSWPILLFAPFMKIFFCCSLPLCLLCVWKEETLDCLPDRKHVCIQTVLKVFGPVSLAPSYA